jgi:hypothetical protein
VNLRIEPKPAIKATLALMLLVGFMVVLIILPDWAVFAVVLPLALGFLWWLLYVAFGGVRLSGLSNEDRTQTRH